MPRRYGPAALFVEVSLALALFLVSGTAGAREEPRVIVRFAPQLAGSDASRLVSAMRAQLRDTASIATGGDVASAMCIVDVDRTEAGIVLRFADAAGHPTGAPRIVARSGEIGASEVATIVRAFVIAAIEHEAAMTDAAQTPAPPATDEPAPAAPAAEAPPPPAPALSAPSAVVATTPTPHRSPERAGAPPETASAPWRARVAAFYTGATYASQLPWQSGARLEGAYAFAPGFYGGVGYAFHPPAEVANDAASVRISRHAATLFVGLETKGRAFAVGADIAAGFDDNLRSTSHTAAALAKTSDAAHVAPTFAFRLHGRFRLPQSPGFALDVAPVFELSPGNRSLVVEDGTSTTAVLSPSIARLRLDVGGTFDGF